ncbi:MAG: ASPIC/UnbV domain-containing protein [Candidatus Latescibacterota bacterium]|nr:MAG: ASPIC/UnbV domain-containing protein [Candidatus Latescibacterota bacterium]
MGTRSNRSAIGARIRVDIVEEGTRRSLVRHVTSGGSFGCNPLRQHIGLGKASSITKLEVFWPTSGETQTFEQMPLDHSIEITGGQSNYRTLELHPATFRAAQSQEDAP